MSINEGMFWAYVELWVTRNKFGWDRLARECGFSRTKMWRLREGKGALTIAEFNCICNGMGLNPLFVLEGSSLYASPFLFEVPKNEHV